MYSTFVDRTLINGESMGPVMDDMCIRNICCRRMFITQQPNILHDLVRPDRMDMKRDNFDRNAVTARQYVLSREVADAPSRAL